MLASGPRGAPTCTSRRRRNTCRPGAVEAGSNVSKWCNKGFNQLIEDAKRITDVPARTNLYEKAQKIFKDEAPWATIAHSTIFRAMSKKVKGYKIDPLGGDIFANVTLE